MKLIISKSLNSTSSAPYLPVKAVITATNSSEINSWILSNSDAVPARGPDPDGVPLRGPAEPEAHEFFDFHEPASIDGEAQVPVGELNRLCQFLQQVFRTPNQLVIITASCHTSLRTLLATRTSWRWSASGSVQAYASCAVGGKQFGATSRRECSASCASWHSCVLWGKWSACRRGDFRPPTHGGTCRAAARPAGISPRSSSGCEISRQKIFTSCW